MSISDEELAAIRRRPAYRAALWLGRLAVVTGFAPLVIAAADDDVSLADAVFACFFPYMSMLVGVGVLLWRAGVPFERHGWSVGTVAEPELNRAITSDFFFRRH
ncbi:hypothetical protein [Micromonospora pallida]|uniref:hypothetical protein n=1 Tax=Micromonospora pallida TaxID=145854 RepID=UPI000A56C914|nr:hypothetical protein [Micromonospora pallida]